MVIPFNKAYITGKEMVYIREVISSGKISGNGKFTQKCHEFFEDTYGFKKALLTTSCTSALEMCALLADIKAGDEIIVPSYTFVSTALAFVRQGAKIVFVDSRPEHPGIDEDKIEPLITNKTRAIVPVHYAGIACDMDKIMALASKYNLIVIEDAAHAIDAYYKKKPLGSIGHLATLSFNETKNISSGEGGLLAINNEKFIRRAEIIWEKGTNRAAFLRGEVSKYEWLDMGSSFLLSEINAAFLWAQLEHLKPIQKKRKEIWSYYYNELRSFASEKGIILPFNPQYSTNNGHIFYLTCKSKKQRDKILNELKRKNINASFHYLSLHKSNFCKNKYSELYLPNADKYTSHLLRLPLYYELNEQVLNLIINTLKQII